MERNPSKNVKFKKLHVNYKYAPYFLLNFIGIIPQRLMKTILSYLVEALLFVWRLCPPGLWGGTFLQTKTSPPWKRPLDLCPQKSCVSESSQEIMKILWWDKCSENIIKWCTVALWLKYCYSFRQSNECRRFLKIWENLCMEKRQIHEAIWTSS